MDESPDSILALFPGSAETAEAVAVLSKLGILDEYMIRNRLRSRLPVLFGPCRRSVIEGDTGKHLADAGVHFLAISKETLAAPFGAFDVTRCRFESERVRIWDEAGSEKTVFDREQCLVLEAVYDSKRRRIPGAFGRKGPDTDRLSLPGASDAAAAGGGERAGVLFLFPKNGDLPLRFMEEDLDFSFLGDRRRLTASENFRQLGRLLAERFGPICRDMVIYAYAIQAVTEEIPEESGRSRRRKRQVQLRSNVSSVHTMARLFHCNWWRQRGWADRVFPP